MTTPRTDGQETTGDRMQYSNVVSANFARELERELNEMRNTLDELHVVIECAPGDIIHDWYCTDPLASKARESALKILNRGRDKKP